jgi:hypothetical protein
MVTVYRSGALPAYEKVANRSSLRFDSYLTLPSWASPRSQSVFATLTLPSARSWIEWRLDGNLDADLWAIHLPETSVVYAHDVRFYEKAAFIRSMSENEAVTVHPSAAFEAVQSYWDSATPVTETLTVAEEQFWEVLIPYQVAKNSTWELVENVKLEDYYQEAEVDTYF